MARACLKKKDESHSHVIRHRTRSVYPWGGEDAMTVFTDEEDGYRSIRRWMRLRGGHGFGAVDEVSNEASP